MADKLFYDSAGGQGLPKAAHDHRMQLERLGVNNPYELRAIIAEQRARLDAYEAGAQAFDALEARKLNPGQLWRKLLDASTDQRLAMLLRQSENMSTAYDCFAQDHQRRLADLTERIEETQRQLSETLGFDQAQPLCSLLVAVRALKNVMVEGIAAREPRVEYAEPSIEDLPEFAGDRDVREKIGEQLKSAGIDTQSICHYQWEGPATDGCDGGAHDCQLVNPLHASAHQCDPQWCGQELTHEEAERIEMAK